MIISTMRVFIKIYIEPRKVGFHTSLLLSFCSICKELSLCADKSEKKSLCLSNIAHEVVSCFYEDKASPALSQHFLRATVMIWFFTSVTVLARTLPLKEKKNLSVTNPNLYQNKSEVRDVKAL